MDGEPVGREEYIVGMTRIHTRVDAVEKTTSSIETSAKSIEKSVCEMHKIMYGSESADGLVTKVSNLNQKVGGAYWLGGVTITALIVAVIGVLVAFVFKTK